MIRIKWKKDYKRFVSEELCLWIGSKYVKTCCCSVAKSWLSATPWLEHTRLLCPPRSPAVHSSSHPLHWSSYITLSSSAAPFSFCLQFPPVSGSFPMSRPFASGGENIDASASATVLPVNTQDWSPLDWLVWSPCSPRDSPEMYTIFIH